MKMQSHDTKRDAAFNVWAKEKDFASEADFYALLYVWRDRQYEFDELRKAAECAISAILALEGTEIEFIKAKNLADALFLLKTASVSRYDPLPL